MLTGEIRSQVNQIFPATDVKGLTVLPKGRKDTPKANYPGAVSTETPVHGELPVTRRLRSVVLFECTFFGRTTGLKHGRVLSLC